MSMESIEIPFGAKDSELKGWEYKIPEGFEAEIKDGKIIVKQAESEDERMIDAIGIALTGDTAEKALKSRGVTLPDALAYLEKQKEQSMTANDLDEEVHRFFDDCIVVHEAKLYGNISERVIPVDCYELTARHFAKWGEKQKAQKPAEWSERYVADIFEKVGLAKIVREQANDELTNAVQDAMLELSKVENAEWSEEDEAIVKFYEDDYNHRIGNMPMKDVVEMRLKFKDWITNRIKTLRPHPHWKPSEEQIKVMQKAVIYFGDSWVSNDQKTLESLYADLKKLM